MEAVVTILRSLSTFVLVALGFAALVQWRRHRGGQGGWAAAAFLTLAASSLIFWLVPDEGGGALQESVQRLGLVLLVLFPYLLYRFTATFEDRARTLGRAAAVLTGALFVVAVLPVDIGLGDDPRPPAAQAYVVALMVQWVGLSMFVTWSLWRAGRDKPAVVRLRMRTLSLGAVGLSIALLVGGSAGTMGWLSAVVYAFALVSALLFFMGLAPPALLLHLWRRPEQERFRVAVAGLMRATQEREVIDDLLPRVARFVGGRGAALIARDGRIVGCEGVTEDEAAAAAGEVRAAPEDPHHAEGWTGLHLSSGWLVVWASAHAPFFGRQEFELLRSLGTLAELALERTDLVIRERAAREALERERSFSEKLVSSTEDGILAFDTEVRYTLWNHAMEKISGVRKDKVIGRSAFEVFPFLREIGEDKFFAESLAGRVAVSHDRRFVIPESGKEGFFEGRYAPLHDEAGDVIGGFAIIRETTERKRLESARAEFIGKATQELSEPLGSLAGLATLLATRGHRLSEDKLREVFTVLKEHGDKARSLAGRLLDFSQLEEGALHISLEGTYLGSSVKRALDSAPAPEGVTVDLAIAAGIMVIADRDRLDQVFSILLANAYESAATHIRVETRDIGEQVIVTFSDDGEGVAAEVEPHLFEPFTRADDGRRGSGLGLAISRRLVDAFGGSIWYEPNDSRGARFLVRLQRVD